jgi:hypothetical protein
MLESTGETCDTAEPSAAEAAYVKKVIEAAGLCAE